jgi:hypothetical protein
VDRLPGRLRGIRRASHRVRLSRHGAFEVGNRGEREIRSEEKKDFPGAGCRSGASRRRQRSAGPGAGRGDSGQALGPHYSASPDIGGAFQYRTGGALSGTSIGDSISNQDFASRYDRLLYQTPSFNGFMGEVSWGHKEQDIAEFALRYSGKIGALGTLAGAVGYSNVYLSEDAPVATTDDKVIGGSISWLHPRGFNLSYAHTTRDLPGRDGKFNYLKAGYKAGKHAVSVDYGMGDDQAASGDEAKVYGVGYVFVPIAWAEVFALYKLHSLDRPGVSLEDITFFMVGSRVKF